MAHIIQVSMIQTYLKIFLSFYYLKLFEVPVLNDTQMSKEILESYCKNEVELLIY